MIEVWFDGAVEPMNPGGHGGYGMLVRRDGQTIYSEAVYVGRWPSLSNNCTEYCGAIGALRYLIREGATQATVYGDADIIINQLNEKWRAKAGAYLPYYREAYALRQQVPAVKFIWIPRERNDAADTLSKEAVTRKPRVVGFQLNPLIETVPQPRITTKRKRTRDVLTLDLREAREDEAWEMFKTRYGGI